MTEPLDCARVSEILPEYLAGRASTEQESAVRSHLEGCADCRNRANAVSLLQQTPVPEPDPGRWDGFVNGVVDATGPRGRSALPRWLWGLAAVILLVVLGLFARDRLTGRGGDATVDVEMLAREAAALPAEEAAAWTAAIPHPGWVPAGFDSSGLSEDELEGLVREVDRT